MIDTHHGKIATVWATMPFKTQIVNAEILEKAEITYGMKLKNRKTTNKIAVNYWLGKKKYKIHTYRSGRSYVTLTSTLGQQYLKEAQITLNKLEMARDVVNRHETIKISKPSVSFQDLSRYDKMDEINTLVKEKQTIQAIKALREAKGCGLAEAKEIIGNWESYSRKIKF